jgi:predicted MFS family arabinose efflux permease
MSGFALAHRIGEAFLDHKNCGAMSRRMKDSKNPVSGGFAIGLGALIGGLWGVHSGQPFLGLGGGIGIGVAIALLVWLVDRQRG